jgi:hypothetical protein
MAENKTKPTEASIAQHIDSLPNEEQRQDCLALLDLLGKVTGEQPRMWGPSIVGFGMYGYKYESGRRGESCLTGFAARKNEVVVYLVASGAEQEALLAKLGRHKMGKSCLYIRRLRDVDTKVLEQLVVGSVAEVRRRYGSARGASPVVSTQVELLHHCRSQR